jgi:hypothetical protein
MESLESKLERLSPDQRKEVEDFVDFLISRSGNATISVNTSSPRLHNGAPPPLTMEEPVHIPENPPFTVHVPLNREETPPSVRNEEPAPPFSEIAAGIDNAITHDYMDYGQFEEQSSPATEAVKKVKKKLIAREAEDKSKHLLDWVD